MKLCHSSLETLSLSLSLQYTAATRGLKILVDLGGILPCE